MTILSTHHPDRPPQVQIEGALTIYEAREAKRQLVEALRMHEILEIDLSGVLEFDTAGMQLLLLLKRTAMEEKRTLRFSGHSRAVLTVIDLYNMAGAFGDPVYIPAGAVDVYARATERMRAGTASREESPADEDRAP